MNQNLELIRQKCIEANPDRDWDEEPRNDNGDRIIRLADVLLAIRHAPNGIPECQGMDGDLLVVRPSVGHGFIWNLRKDLDEQSEQTINLLADLLK